MNVAQICHTGWRQAASTGRRLPTAISRFPVPDLGDIPAGTARADVEVQHEGQVHSQCVPHAGASP